MTPVKGAEREFSRRLYRLPPPFGRLAVCATNFSDDHEIGDVMAMKNQ
jgi:hypothetical protein